MTAIATIGNGEAGSSVRTKLNAVIGAVNVSGNPQTGAYTVAASDDLDMVPVTSASGVNVTLPNDLPVGFSTTIVQMGAGAVTFVAGSGATLNSRGAVYATAGQYAVATAMVITNGNGTSAAWVLTGDLA